jgi:lysophospholipase L1-like esterase
VALPGAETAPSGAEASEAERKPSALGHFVPIENEAALDHFHKALARLAAGNDDDGKVRIMAYGASHTQADTYTGYLRAYLQSRFGDGGQGFVLLGRVNQWYRTSDTRALHRGLTIHHARYRLDGHDEPLGLFGAALVGRYAGSFGEIITSKTSPNTQFELHYFKQPDGGDFSVHVDGKTTARIQTKSERAGLGWHSVEASPGQHRIRAQLHGSGPVRLFGISAETAGAGVVVDTLGIGGSRMTSNLRWQQDCWTEALRHRSPDLVTFAYGTNEAMAPEESLASYERQLRAVLARLRKASPHVSCVLIAPFELPARAHGRLFQTRLVKIVHAQRRVSKELGCGFWDGYAFMGGEGSMRRWMLADLASTDQIHLTRRGYVYVGIALGDALMRAYDLDPARWSGLAAVATPSGPSH